MAFTNYNNQQLTLSGVWNNSAVDYTRFKINVSDVSSASTSKLLDLQTNGQSRFSVRKDGNLTIISGTTQYPVLRLQGSDRSADITPASFGIGIRVAGINVFSYTSLEGGSIGLYNNVGTTQTLLYHDNQNDVLALRRTGDNPQSLRIYNTYTNTGSYERAGLNWNANAFEIETEASGVGSARNLVLGTSGTPRMVFSGTGARIDVSGPMFFTVTNSVAVPVIGINTNTSFDGLANTFGQPTIVSQNNQVMSWLNQNVITQGTAKIGWVNTAGTGMYSHQIDTSMRRSSAGVVEFTSSIEVLSSVRSPIVSATTYLNLYPNVSSLLDGNYVNVSGDTITGALTVSAPTTTALTVVGTQTQNNGFFSAAGDADKISYVMRAITKNGSSVEMFLDGASTRQIIPANTSWNATVRIVAKTDKFENRYATFDRKLLISKGDTNATTQIIGPVQVLGIDTGSTAGSPPAGWGVSLTADTTNGSLKINVTGEIGTYVRWVANVDLVEVGYEGSFGERTESLFANGEEGVWFDASGFDINWRRNLLTYTEDFSDATWNKTNVNVSSDFGIAPNGTLTADKLVETSATGQHGIGITISTIIQGYYRFSAYVKSAGRTQLQFTHTDNVTTGKSCVFNIETNEITSNTYNPAPEITDVGNGWKRISVPAILGENNTFQGFINITVTGSNNYAGNNLDGILVWGMQLERGTVTTPYQKITNVEASFRETYNNPNMFVDYQGRDIVTGVEQSVGLILDKSKNLDLGLEEVLNGSFDGIPNGTDVISLPGSNQTSRWLQYGNVISRTIEDGLLRLETSSNNTGVVLDVRTEIPGIYKLTYDYFGQGAASNYIQPAGGLPATNYARPSGVDNYIYVNFASSGTQQIYFRVNGNSVSGGIGFYDNVSLKLVKGNHASQSNSGYRPTLRSRYNLLTYSEQFNSSDWVKSFTGVALAPTVITNQASAPDGTLTADRIQFNLNNGTTTTDVSLVRYQNIDMSGIVTYSIYVKPFNSASSFNMLIVDPSGNGVPIVVSGSDWTRYTVSGNQNGVVQYGLRIRGGQTPTNSNTADVLAWGAQLNYGTSALRYQLIETSTRYDTSGFLPYLDFDGSNDHLATNNINFSSTNTSSITLQAGIYKTANSDTAIVAELSQNSVTTNGSFALFSNITSSTMRWRVTGVSPYDLNYAIGGAGFNYILTTQGFLRTNLNTIRLNGVFATSQTSEQWSGFFGNQPLYIGARSGPVYPFKGRLYSLVVRGALTNPTVLPLTENYVAQQTGVTLP